MGSRPAPWRGGDDRLNGGGDADWFEFRGSEGAGLDVVEDLDAARGDRLRFFDIDGPTDVAWLATLALAQVGDDTEITAEQQAVALLGVIAADLDTARIDFS